MEYGSGDFIRLRGRRWLVEGVRHNPVVGPLLKLSCLEDDAQGDALEVAIGSEIKPERLDDSWNLLGGQGVDDPAVFGSQGATWDASLQHFLFSLWSLWAARLFREPPWLGVSSAI